MIDPLTQMQRLDWLRKRPNKSARSYKRRHRASIIFLRDSFHPELYRNARKVLPLP